MKASVSGGSGGGAKKKLGVQKPQAAAANRYTKSTNEGRRAGARRTAGGPGSPGNAKRLENDKAFFDGWNAGAAAQKKAHPKPKSPFQEKISSSTRTRTGNSSKAPKVLQRRPTASRFPRG